MWDFLQFTHHTDQKCLQNVLLSTIILTSQNSDPAVVLTKYDWMLIFLAHKDVYRLVSLNNVKCPTFTSRTLYLKTDIVTATLLHSNDHTDELNWLFLKLILSFYKHLSSSSSSPTPYETYVFSIYFFKLNVSLCKKQAVMRQ